MNRQCRICLDTNDPETMISPCYCRGTSQFIHTECFAQYLQHYPDGMCRVCRKSMIFVYPYEIILFGWMMFLIASANIPLHIKIVYILMVTPAFVTNRIHKIFTLFSVVALSIASVGFLVVIPRYRIPAIIGFTILGCLATIIHYIPPQYILMITTIAIASLYACFLTIYIATTTDPYMLSFFVGFVTILWTLCVNLRPPFRAIN